MNDRPDETLSQLEHELERRFPLQGLGEETARGWIRRLIVAGMDFVRAGETAAAWERLNEVERQAEAFFSGSSGAAAEKEADLHETS